MSRINELLEEHRLKEAIQQMSGYAANYPEVRASERLEKISDDYQLMLDFMCRGYKDDKREEMYRSLIRKLYILEKDISQAEHIRKNALYNEAYTQVSRKHWEYDLIRYTMENFVTDVAMLSLADDAQRNEKERELYERHADFMTVLFKKIWLSYQWTEVDASFYESLFLSPTIESRDVQLLVSAMTLALIRQFDILKFRTLIRVYRQSGDTYVCQRALVGIAFAMNSDTDFMGEQQQMVMDLLSDEHVCQELLELQIQVVYCLKAEEDNRKIQEDIMPTLLKNQNFEITRFGIVEKEEDPMDDILHPGAADQAMEEMEKTFGRMMDMQKAGSDIYFGGFSMMKSFPFFRDVANWLTPFYKEHPALNRIVDKLGNTQLMEHLVNNGPFCDSDKYSFAFAMSSVIDRLPDNIKEMLNSVEALGPVVSEEELKTPAYIRRMYVQDLYRFFRLFVRKNDLVNPFLRSKDYPHTRRCIFFAEPLLRESPLVKYVVELGNFLLKHQCMEELDLVIANFESKPAQHMPTELESNIPFMLLMAARDEWASSDEQACSIYKQIIAMDEGNLRALKNLARLSFSSGDFGRAAQCYQRLTTLQPEKKSYVLNYSAVLLKLGEVDKAMPLIYKLDYDNPDDVNVQRVKAWGLMAQGKLEQARELYARLRQGDQPQAADSLNAGYCEWIAGDIKVASDLFRDYLAQLNNDQYHISIDFEHDADFLIEKGITRIDMALMQDLI